MILIYVDKYKNESMKTLLYINIINNMWNMKFLALAFLEIFLFRAIKRFNERDKSY